MVLSLWRRTGIASQTMAEANDRKAGVAWTPAFDLGGGCGSPPLLGSVETIAHSAAHFVDPAVFNGVIVGGRGIFNVVDV